VRIQGFTDLFFSHGRSKCCFAFMLIEHVE